MKKESFDLTDVILTAINSKLIDVHTSMPGQVVSYDRVKQTAKIQPCIKRKYSDGKTVDLPIINGVPVSFPRAKDFLIHFDLTPGDFGILVFSERSLDNWKDKGGVVSADDPRKFNLSDAFFIPGASPTATPATLLGPAGALEIVNKTASIIMDQEGKIEAKNSGGILSMDKGGKFKLTNNTNELISLLSDLTNILATTTVNTMLGPMKLNDFAAIQEIKTKIDTLKGA